MGKLLLTGVDGNLGSQAAEYLLELEPVDNLIFCGYSEAALQKYADMGVETHVTNFNFSDGLKEAFAGADRLALISMPFVGAKRQNAHKNVVDAAKAAGVKQVIYTSLVNAGDETNPSVEKKDHIYTENYIKESGLDYIFLRNSQYAEAMITNYFTYVKLDGVLKNNQGDGKMAYISRKDCAKAVAYALHRGAQYDHATLNINGPELMTISQFIAYGNQGTGNQVSYQEDHRRGKLPGVRRHGRAPHHRRPLRKGQRGPLLLRRHGDLRPGHPRGQDGRVDRRLPEAHRPAAHDGVVHVPALRPVPGGRAPL